MLRSGQFFAHRGTSVRESDTGKSGVHGQVDRGSITVPYFRSDRGDLGGQALDEGAGERLGRLRLGGAVGAPDRVAFQEKDIDQADVGADDHPVGSLGLDRS